MPWPVGVAVGLGAGAAIGALNGALVAYARLPSFLVTLATMGVFAGIGRRLTDLKSVPIENDVFNGLFGSGSLFGVPSLFWWTLAAAAIGYYALAETRFGAHVLATGDNPRAARATGIEVPNLRFIVMTMSGALAGLAGLLYAGRLHGARYTLGEGDLLTVIAAVIVGGTRLNGGEGSILGALIGSWLMGMLNNGLILMGYEPSDQMIARGLIILCRGRADAARRRPLKGRSRNVSRTHHATQSDARRAGDRAASGGQDSRQLLRHRPRCGRRERAHHRQLRRRGTA